MIDTNSTRGKFTKCFRTATAKTLPTLNFPVVAGGEGGGSVHKDNLVLCRNDTKAQIHSMVQVNLMLPDEKCEAVVGRIKVIHQLGTGRYSMAGSVSSTVQTNLFRPML